MSAAVAMFGKSGKQLLPLINDFEAVRNQVRDTAQLMSNKAVEDAAKFKDQMEALSTTFKSLSTNTGFIEYLNSVSEALIAVTKNAENFKKIGGKQQVDEGNWFDKLVRANAEGGMFQYTARGLQLFGIGKELNGTTGRFDLTPAEKESLEAQKAKGQSATKDKQEKAKEQEIVREQTKYEEQNKKAIEEQARAIERALEAKQKQRDAAREMVEDMQHEVEMQKMIADGKEREASIQDAIYRAKKRSSELSEDDLATIADQAGQLFDLNETKKDKEPKREEVKTTALERIGAVLGGGRSSDPSYRVQNEHLRVAKETKEIQQKILEKTTDNALGAV